MPIQVAVFVINADDDGTVAVVFPPFAPKVKFAVEILVLVLFFCVDNGAKSVFVYCVADEEDIIEAATLAKVANQCMQMKGVNACFVIGRTAVDETRISCRSDGTINVQLLAEKLNGGGHFTQAACTFKKMSLEQVESRLLSVLNDYLNDARII